MSDKMRVGTFTKELYDLLGETFEKVEGIYLDRNTSFFETLESLSAEQASTRAAEKGQTIAAHVEHVRFYLRVLQGCIEKKDPKKVDWKESWKLQNVTEDEWKELKRGLHETYQSVLASMKSLETWEGEDDIGASLGILAHTAYHLGSIRQILVSIR
ncbi:MAG: DinB family protein [bacterium]|nr:DinB family protein [bacterium]